MSNSNLAPEIAYRPNLYYGQYDYCLRAYQPEFFCLRDMDHARIDHLVGLRRDWGRRMQSRQPGSWYWQALEITENDIDNLHVMCDWLQSDARDRKLIIAGSWFYVYTNDRTLIDDLTQLPWLDTSKFKLTQVHLRGQPGTVTLRRPRHGLRSHFRSIVLDERRKNNLSNILAQQQGIRLSPSLLHWIDNPKWHRTAEYHFIDHDDHGIITLLALIEPRLIRRTQQIMEHK